MLAQADC